MSQYTDLIAQLRDSTSETEHRCADALEALQAERDAIDALHQPLLCDVYDDGEGEFALFHLQTTGDGLRVEHWCPQCEMPSPCPTHRILHPGEPT